MSPQYSGKCNYENHLRKKSLNMPGLNGFYKPSPFVSFFFLNMFNWGFTTGTPCNSPASPASLRPPQTPRRRPRCPPCFSLQHAAVPSANTCLKVCTLLGVIIGDYLRVKGQTIGPKYVWFLVFFHNFNNPASHHCLTKTGNFRQEAQQFGNQRSSLAILKQRPGPPGRTIQKAKM